MTANLPDPNAQFTYPVLYRRCRAADLSARADGWGPAMGTAYEWVFLTNRSSSPCSLAGSPTAVTDVLRDGTKHHVAVVTRESGYGNGEDAVANLQPGQVGRTQLSQRDTCPGFRSTPWIPRFEVELPDGSAVQVTVPGSRYQAPAVGCALSVSWFGTPHVFVPEPKYATDPLLVSMTLPPQVRAGSTIDYTVTLSNPTGKAVPLIPCPVYQEAIVIKSFDPPAAVERSYRLNCLGTPRVPAYQALTFAMRLPAPRRTGLASLSWSLQPTSDVIVGRAVTVVR